MKKIKSDGRGQIIRSSKIQRKMTKGRWGGWRWKQWEDSNKMRENEETM